MKSIKIILSLNLTRNIHNRNENYFTIIFKDEQQRLQTTPFNKKTDRQSYLHAKLNITVSLKKSVPCSQILRVKIFFQQTANPSAIVKY